MAQLIPLSRLARLVGQPRSALQRMAQKGELKTFDGHVDLQEVLRLFPDVRMEDDAEIRRVEEIKATAHSKPPEPASLPDAAVLYERLKALSRDYAAAHSRLRHFERVQGWIPAKLDEARELGDIAPHFAEHFLSWLKREMAAPAADMQRWEELVARERIMRVMSAQVKVLPKGHPFEIVGNETILEAGLRAGLSLPYGCSNGSCGDCKCRIVEGDVVKVRPHDFVLSATDKAQGYALSCSYTAVRDIAIEVPMAGVADIPEQTIRARVRLVEPLGGRRIALHLLSPRAERMRYLAGQSFEITLGGESRIVPVAGCPCEERRIEVHVECDAEDEQRERMFANLQPNEEVVVRGPFGTFVLDDASERPLVLIAAGPGFASIKSLLQHALSLEQAPSITLYRFANAEGAYQENLLRSYANALEHFRFESFAVDADAPATIAGIARSTDNLTGADVYAAGEAALIEQARAAFIGAGLPEAQWKSLIVA
ncbi:MAG: 2Fe-2S iron-sulfur cluster binding domain-containing protein [Hyphomicrobiaceae bacterium]|nr:2Fe-2S iron-sulfur cluster binding domain-containing protein [Hyphomicrobiaceae bacterium]